jgi:LEA14-like dessication related protein
MEQRGQNSGLLWVGIAAGGYLLYRNVVKPNIIDPVRLKQYTGRLRVNLPAVRFKGDNVEMDLYIQNPNSYPITIRAIVGDVFVTTRQGQTIKIGNLDRYGDVVIKPLAETKYTFSIRLKVLELSVIFTTMLQGRGAGMTVTLKGTINVNDRPVPVTESIRL